MSDPLRIGIIGMGFIGQTHARAFRDAAADGYPCRLRAVCDPDPERLTGLDTASGNITSGSTAAQLFDPDTIATYNHADQLLADDQVDLVCVCTHTDSHVDLAIRALNANKHVLVEKPVATTCTAIERLIERADRSDRLVIPAMCVRSWPGWSHLKQCIEDDRYGRVVHARFERLGGPPQWASDFYADANRSGGAIFDLHVHDADFAMHLFGPPQSVFSTGSRAHIQTLAIYPDGPKVSIEGGWLNDPSFPFRMTYTVEFERAVVTFDSRRDHPMEIHTGGETQRPDIGSSTGFDQQARAICSALTRGQNQQTLPTLRETLAVTKFIEAELVSTESGRPEPL
ncbi:MAG: Gfo/Idh/MocA family protein [Phycisphaerales bacterium JB050]